MTVTQITDRTIHSQAIPKPRNCSLLSGRVFTSFAKVGLTSLLGFGGAFFSKAGGAWPGSAVENSSQNSSQNAVFAVIRAVGNITAPAYTLFGKYLYQFVDPGYRHVPDGACSLEGTPVISKDHCADVVKQTTKTMKDLKFVDETTKPTSIGRIIPYKNSNKNEGAVRILVSRDYQDNYKAALQYVEKEFLAKIPENKRSFIEFVYQVSHILAHGTIGNTEALEKMYRKSETCIHLPGAEKVSAPSLASKRIKPGVHTYERGDFDKDQKELNQQGFICLVRSENIAQEMELLAELFIQFVREGRDAVEIASLLHTEIARISPFQEISTHLAALLMNAALVRFGGYDPVVFHSNTRHYDVTYTAVAAKDYKMFVNYLQDEQMPWVETNKLSLLDEPVVSLLPEAESCMMVGDKEYNDIIRSHDPELFKRYQTAINFTEVKYIYSDYAFIQDTQKTVGRIEELQQKLVDGSVYRTSERYSNMPSTVKTPFHHVAPDKIKGEMKLFVEKLRAFIETKTDPVLIAAFAHKKIFEIWPFEGDNLLLARTVMYAILARFARLKPFCIPDARLYLEFIAKSELDFADFLRELIPAK